MYLDFTRQNPDAVFYVPTRHPEFVNLYHEELTSQIIPIGISEYKSMIKGLLNSNRILIVGGGIWSKYTGRFAHLIPLAILGSHIKRTIQYFKDRTECFRCDYIAFKRKGL